MKPHYWLGVAGLALVVLGVPLWVYGVDRSFTAAAVAFFAFLFGGLLILAAVIITVINKSRRTPGD